MIRNDWSWLLQTGIGNNWCDVAIYSVDVKGPFDVEEPVAQVLFLPDRTPFGPMYIARLRRS